MTITGTGLPTANITVKFANTECDLTTLVASDTSVTCSLKVLPAAGSWNVRLIEERGLIPIESSVALIDVALVVNSVSPNTDLNQLGGDELTFAGTGFDTDTALTNITLSDNTTCIVTTALPTALSCIVDGFNATTLNTASPYTLDLVVNGISNSD